LKGGRLTTSVLDTDSESIWCRTHLCALYFWYVLNFVLHFLQKVHLCFWSRRSVVHDVLHISESTLVLLKK
jgi:hypothetical protein